MSFTRYEIRTYIHTEFGVEFDYTPFDNHEQLIKYLKDNKDYQTDTDSYVCKVKLYSNHDSCQKLATTKEYWELHQRGIV